MVIGLVFTACEPMDNIYSEIDAQEEVVVGDAIYTLTADDYDELGLNYGNFSSVDDVKSIMPAFLSDKYPVWGDGSSVLLGFDLYVGSAFSISEYSLEQADYTFSGSDLMGFQSDATPGDYLGDILADNISYPEEGDYVVAKYSQFTGDAYTVSPTVSYGENFDYGTSVGDLLTISGGAWVNHSGTDNQLQYDTSSLSMSGYPTSGVGGSMLLSSSGSEDVNSSFTPITSKTVYSSALINLSTVGGGTYFFHFMEEDGSYNYSGRVGAKSDGSGNILFGIGASSSTLTYGTTAFNLNTTYLLVASYNIENGVSNLYVLSSVSNYEPSTPEASNTGAAGNSVNRIGIRQASGGPTCAIDGIRIANTWSSIMSNDELSDEVVGDKINLESIYNYNGGDWEIPASAYSLTSEDYDAMGTDYGQPGKYNNFDSSMDIENYISTFLGLKYPFAMDEDNLDVMYKYYSSSAGATQTRGNSYTFVNNVWVAYQSVIGTTLQFGHDGSSWVPDNTIKYTLVQADYDLVGNGFYANFDVRGGKDEETVEVRLAKINSILLNNFPGMDEGQKFTVFYDVYSGAAEVWELKVILSGGEYILQ